MLKNSLCWLQEKYWQCLTTLTLALPSLAFADDTNPFPEVDVSGDVTSTTGTNMERALKYACLGIGGILVIIGILVLIHRLNEDSKTKEHGNLIMTIVLVGFCLTIGC